MPEPKVRYPLTLHIPEQEFARIQEIAAKEKRKMANCITWIIRRGLEELDWSRPGTF